MHGLALAITRMLVLYILGPWLNATTGTARVMTYVVLSAVVVGVWAGPYYWREYTRTPYERALVEKVRAKERERDVRRARTMAVYTEWKRTHPRPRVKPHRLVPRR